MTEADERPLAVETLPVGPLQANCYLAVDRPSRRALVIDPGDEADRILAALRRLDLHVDAIAVTHGHFDHIGAVSALRREIGVPFLAPEGERAVLEGAAARAALYGLLVEPPPPPDRWIREGETVTCGAVVLAVAATPGHSPGHIILVGPGAAFVGDLVFAGSVGRTDIPGGNTDALMLSIARHVLPLPDRTVLYPGHGPPTTVEAERATNPFILRLLQAGL